MNQINNDQESNDYSFIATGSWNIPKQLKPFFGSVNNVIGFKLPDGRSVRLVIALEVENHQTGDIEYVTSEREMDRLGFYALEYDRLDFEPIED